MKQHRSARVAFTLVELVVVSAILTLLIGMLVPAIQKGREAAHRARCQNNVKQIGIALGHYHAAHRAFPDQPWPLLLRPFLDDGPIPSDPLEMPRISVFECPSDKTLPRKGRPAGCSYGLNPALLGRTGDTMPEGLVWLGEFPAARLSPLGCGPQLASLDLKAFSNHEGGGHILLGGAVRFLRSRSMPEGAGDTFEEPLSVAGDDF